MLPSLIVSAEDILHPAELAKWQQMAVAKRRDEWLHGRWTAKRLLTAPGMPWEGEHFANLAIENAPEGAPFVRGAQAAGCLSITHSQGMAACAFLPGAGGTVGIDLERIEPREEVFVRDFFTPYEAEVALALMGEARDAQVTLVWSAKEAVLKAWQKGLRLDSRAVEIITEGIGNWEDWAELKYQALVDGFPRCRLFWRREGDFMLTLAVAIPGDELPPGTISRVVTG